MNKRRVTGIIVIFILCTAMCMEVFGAIPMYGGEVTDGDEAYVICTKTAELKNIEIITPKSPTMIKNESIAGKDVWVLNNAGTVYPYIYFDIGERLGSSGKDGSAYTIEVEYYDLGNSYMVLWYDSLFYGRQIAGEIYLSGSEQWKTASFTINDAAFSGGVDNTGDFMLSMFEKGSYVGKSVMGGYVHSIRIKREKSRNPVLVHSDTDESGNTFEYFKKEKTVRSKLTNTTRQAVEADCTFRLVDVETENIEFSVGRHVIIPPRETVEVPVNIETEHCGLYEWRVDVLADNVDSEFNCITVAIVKTDPNGIKSEFGWVNSHLERYKQKEQQSIIDQMKKANIAGTRRQINWAEIGRTMIAGGGYATDGNVLWDSINLCKENNVDMMFLLMGSGNNYSYSGMPDTDERVSDFEKFCEFVMKNTRGVGKLYEIWNEPNIKSFNVDNTDPIWLSKITKAARRAADKYNPDAEIAGMSITEIRRDDAHYWLNGTLETGIADSDGMDVMALHTYAPNYPPEETKMYEVIKNDYITAVAEHGKPDIPVAITEFGYNPKDTDGGMYDQSNWNVRTGVLFKSEGVGDYMFQYSFERKGMLYSDREDNFGMVSCPYERYNIKGKVGIPRIAYLSYAAMNYVLGGQITPDGNFDAGDGNIFMRRFESDKFGSKVLTMWSASEPEYVTLDLGTDHVDFYDNYGNKKIIYGQNGIFTFLLDERMSYIAGDFKKNNIVKRSELIMCDKAEFVAAERDKIDVDINVPGAYDCYAEAEIVGTGDIECIRQPNGIYKLKGDISGSKGKTAYINLYLKQNEKIIHYSQIPVVFNSAVSSSITFIPTDSSDYDRWKGIADIKNYTMGSVLKCGIEFTEPQELVQNGIIDAGYLSPGEEKSVDIDFKGIEEKGFKNIKYKIILNDGENEIEFEQRCDFNVAAYAKSAVVIDGNRDEWPDNIMMKAVGPGAFKALDGFMCRDEEDKSAGISVMWDEDNLYIYSEVTDDIYYQVEQPDKSWKGDGLQFGLYIDTGEEDSLAIGQAYTNFNEIGVSVLPDSNRVATYRFKTQNEKTEIGLCKTATGAVVRNGTKTYYEWSMPWEDITGQKGWKPKSGDRLGFSVLWNDNDGDGRKGWLEYASGIGVEKNRQLFTYLYFIK